MSTEPTYSELLAAALGLDPATATVRDLATAQVVVNRRARAEWIGRTLDRVHCRPVLTGDPHDVLELVARRDWPHPLLSPHRESE
jgi:hypothetical protein